MARRFLASGWLLGTVLALSAGAACIGNIGDGSGSGVSQQGLCADGTAPGAAPIRRMTAWEYNNTIRDLFGDDSAPANSFPAEGGSGFDNNADVAAVSRLLAEKFMLAAEEVATRAVGNMAALLPCDPAAAGEDACVRQFVESFGPRAWRRPLAADEVDAFMALFAAMRASYPFETGVRAVLEALLQSPHFIYRVEFGIPGEAAEVVRIGDWEMASRLSYFLWGTMPDQALFDAAAAGQLSTKELVAAQARRMLDDPRARRVVVRFHQQWLSVNMLADTDKDGAMFPEFTDTLRASMMRELDEFVEHAVFDDAATLQTLLTASYSYVDAELAALYGVAPPSGGGFARVDLDPTERAGILTQAGILAVHAKANQTSPVARGLFVRQQLLCQLPPPPPDNVDIVLPDLDPNLTTRERFSQHSADPACSPCHDLFDPIGLGLEKYDAIGRYRETEGGLPIDATGEVFSSDIAGSFDGPIELAARLAQSQDVRSCTVRQWFRFGYGRVESKADRCNVDRLNDMFAESGYNIRELLVALTQTDAFLYRPAVVTAEGGTP